MTLMVDLGFLLMRILILSLLLR